MPKKKQTPVPVFTAIILAVFVGSWLGTNTLIFGFNPYNLFKLVSQLFINSLTLIVVPLVSSSIITGIARVGNDASFRRLSAKMLVFYATTTLIAILLGLAFVNLLNPGSAISSTHLQLHASSAEAIVQRSGALEGNRLVALLLSIIPSNIIDAFSSGRMLGLIFFSLLFGYSLSRISHETRSTLLGFWQGVFQATIYMTHLIMKCLPIGVFCLVAEVFATTGLDSLLSLGLFATAVILGLLTFMFIALPLMLKYIAKVKPFRHIRAVSPALITAFSTSSSSATLPVTMDCLEKRAGVSNRICSLTVPLGTSLNMAGSALYECVAAMFVAQAYGIELSFMTQGLIVFVSLLASIGVAGIPAASLVAVIIILKATGLPIEGIGLFVAMDRLLDMCRTTVNVFSDSCCAVLIARSEGEKDILTTDRFEPL